MIIDTRSLRNQKLVRALVWISAVILVLTAVGKAASMIWLNSQRTELERTLTEVTGLKTRINGTISAILFPTPGISLGGITMEYAGKTIVAATSLETNFEPLPLLHRKLVPFAIDIDRLWLQLPADKLGHPVLPAILTKSATPTTGTTFGPQLPLPSRLELHNSTVIIQSPSGEELHAIKGLNLAAHPIQNKASLPPDGSPLRDDWELQMYLNFAQAKLARLQIGPTRLEARFGSKKGNAEISDAKVFDGSANGKVSWQSSASKPEFHAGLTLTNFDASQSMMLFRPKPFIKGRLNMVADLSGKGKTFEEILKSTAGNVQLHGTDLELVSTNLDELVTRIISSKQYNLVDALAYFFIGPFGASATKSLDIASVARELSKPGTTPNKIKRIHTSWQLTKGVATAKDVAMQTQRYLLALKGRVNLVKREFNNVEIAVINQRGCAIAVQKLSGPIKSPSIGKTDFLLTLTRPMLDALTKSAKGLIDANCDSPFYNGVLLSDAKTPAPDSTQKPTGNTETKTPGATETKTPGATTGGVK